MLNEYYFVTPYVLNKQAYHVCARDPPNMNGDDLEPQVTGLSPKEGKEGTKIIIRGQNLGKDKHDLKSNVFSLDKVIARIK